MKTDVGICVGHSRKINGHFEGGAVSVGGVQEHVFNSVLAGLIHAELGRRGISSIVVSEYDGNGYTSAQHWVAARLRALETKCAVELHFNAADDPAANGHEWLYWGTSANGKRLAESLRAFMLAGFPEIRDRGTKPKDSRDRGAEFLRGTHCPAVICEPFFGSNSKDWRTAVERQSDLAKSIAAGIAGWIS